MAGVGVAEAIVSFVVNWYIGAMCVRVACHVETYMHVRCSTMQSTVGHGAGKHTTHRLVQPKKSAARPNMVIGQVHGPTVNDRSRRGMIGTR